MIGRIQVELAFKDWRPDSVPDINSAPTAMWGDVGRKS